MTTWRSPRLDVGQFGLPWLAVLVRPWQLTARTDEPADLALRPVSCPQDWDLLVPHPSACLSLDPQVDLVLHLGPGSVVTLYLGPGDRRDDRPGRLLAPDPTKRRNTTVRRRFPARQRGDAGRADAGHLTFRRVEPVSTPLRLRINDFRIETGR